MNNIDAVIRNMYENNDEQIIINGIFSEKPILVANAIIAGTQKNILKTTFINKLKELTESKEIVVVPISSLAIAALDVLNIKKYKGTDDFIKNIIGVKLRFD